MNPLNAILLGALVALAVKHRNATDTLGHWRWIAGVAAALFPYSEIFLYFVGPGAMAQGMHGLTWSLILMPVYAVGLAGFLGMLARESWEEMFPPVVGGLAATWILAALTEPGVFPLALLLDWRLGLAVLSSFDIVIFGLCAVGIGMAYAFRIFDRDLARLTLLCVLGYVVVAGFWSWQAREFGEKYAAMQEIQHPVVHVLPQALSPLNWRVVVIEANGKLHETLITLGRGAGRRMDSEDPYRPRDEAVWKIHRRYGELEVPEETQRQVRLAWYGWQNTPYGWLGRYAVFERLYVPQEVGIGVACVGFRDFRVEKAGRLAGATYVVCPWRGTRVRVFQPAGPMDKKGNWPGMRELVAYEGVRN